MIFICINRANEHACCRVAINVVNTLMTRLESVLTPKGKEKLATWSRLRNMMIMSVARSRNNCRWSVDENEISLGGGDWCKVW